MVHKHDRIIDILKQQYDPSMWEIYSDMNILIAQKDFDNAMKYAKIIAQETQSDMAYIDIAKLHWYMGEHDESIKLYEAIKENENYMLDAISSLCAVYLDYGDLEKAIEYAEKTLEIPIEPVDIGWLQTSRADYRQNQINMVGSDIKQRQIGYSVLKDVYERKGDWWKSRKYLLLGAASELFNNIKLAVSRAIPFYF